MAKLDDLTKGAPAPARADNPIDPAVIAERLSKLTFAHTRLTLRATSRISLPHNPGATLRGGFGVALKASVCTVAGGDCQSCLLRSRCTYPYLFETPIPLGSTRLARAPQAPHPVLVELPQPTGRPLENGEHFAVDAVLFGAGLEQFPYVVRAFELLGRTTGLGRKHLPEQRGTFTLEAAAQVRSDGTAISVLDRAARALSDLASETIHDRLHTPIHTITEVVVTFSSPTQLVFHGQPVTVPEFHVLIRNLLRRCSNLVYFHGRSELDLPFRDLVEAAHAVHIVRNDARWITWERYSRRQGRRVHMGGILGSVAYRGEIAPFWPLLRLGAITHAGKHTAFGLGKFDAQLTPGQI